MCWSLLPFGAFTHFTLVFGLGLDLTEIYTWKNFLCCLNIPHSCICTAIRISMKEIFIPRSLSFWCCFTLFIHNYFHNSLLCSHKLGTSLWKKYYSKAWPSLGDNKLVFVPTFLALLKAKWKKLTYCTPYKENCF